MASTSPFFHREVLDDLMKWKNSPRYGKIIEGCPRVGKTTLALEFAKQFDEYLYIDFATCDDAIKDCFETKLGQDLSDFYFYFEVATQKRLSKGSLVIFDNIDLCPRAFSALQLLVGDGRYSYLSIKENRISKKDTPHVHIPADQNYILLRPLSFEEFLYARGKDLLAESYRDNPFSGSPLLHQKLREEFLLYLIVGGMPEAVSAFVATSDFDETERVKTNILKSWLKYIDTYAEDEAIACKKLMRELRSLETRRGAYDFSSLGYKHEDAIAAALFWLETSYMTISSSKLDSLFISDERFYLADTGLFFTLLNPEAKIATSKAFKNILWPKNDQISPIYLENACAVALSQGSSRIRRIHWWGDDWQGDELGAFSPFILINWKAMFEESISAYSPPFFKKEKDRACIESLEKNGYDVWKPAFVGLDSLLVEKNQITYPAYLLEKWDEFIDVSGEN